MNLPEEDSSPSWIVRAPQHATPSFGTRRLTEKPERDGSQHPSGKPEEYPSGIPEPCPSGIPETKIVILKIVILMRVILLSEKRIPITNRA